MLNYVRFLQKRGQLDLHIKKNYKKGERRELVKLNKLNELIRERGIKRKAIAKELGISQQALWFKLNGKHAFSLEDAKVLCKVLRIETAEEKVEIFL